MKMPDFIGEARPAAGTPSSASPSLDKLGAVKKLTAFWRGWSKRERWAAALLLVVPFIVYWPCLTGSYVWDDESWTTMLFPHLSGLSGLFSIWVHPTVLQQYYPVTATTFWLDYTLWGFHPLPYHLENTLGHGLSAVLFWRLLRRWRLPGCWLAGAIFAVHPVMAESIAWITERKNVMSLIFYLAALHAYSSFAGDWNSDVPEVAGATTSKRNWRMYLLAAFFFVLALLGKITAFSFPAVVLVICWWKRGRLRWREDVLPVLPLFAITIVLGIYISWLEKFHVGASGRDWDLTFLERCLVAGRALWFYAAKIFWPSNLCFIYPHWHMNAASLVQWLYPIAAALAVVALWLARKWIGRGPVAAVCIFAGSLFPVLGFMNAYFMRFSFVCNHLVYVSSLALIAPAAAMIVRIAQKFPAPAVRAVGAVAMFSALGFLTWQQSMTFTDVETLYRVTLAKNPDADMPRINLARLLLQRGQTGEAITYFQQAVNLWPDDALTHNDLGVALLEASQPDAAILELQKAIALQPDYANAHFTLGDAYFRLGRRDDAKAEFETTVKYDSRFAQAYVDLGTIFESEHQDDQAVTAYEKAVRAQPDDPSAQNNLGRLLLVQGDVENAVAHLRKAVELSPDEPVSCDNLATALLAQGQVDEAVPLLERAVQHRPDYTDALYNLGQAMSRQGNLNGAATNYQRAIEVEPDNAAAHHGLGIVYFRQAHPAEALAEFQKALDLQPQSVEANSTMAWFLAICPDPAFRDAARAVDYAQKAEQLSHGRDPSVLSTLATAYAVAGRRADAIATASKGLDLATTQGNAALAESLRKQLNQFDGGAGNGAAGGR